MTTRHRFRIVGLLFLATSLLRAQNSIGIFENHSDVGTVLHAGTAFFDSAKHTYTLTGSGENMWTTHDEFQFVWKKVSGDVELTADVSFANSSGNEHKKAVLIFRQSLDTDSVYVDVALHGNGLTALQYRDERGGTTREIQSSISNYIMVEGAKKIPMHSDFAAARLRLTRRGDYVYLSVGRLERAEQPAAYDGESI